MDLEYFARQKTAVTLAANVGLTLVENADITSPCTDGKSIFVPKYNPSWEVNSEDYVKWWGSFYHEIAHNDRLNDNAVSIAEAKRKVTSKERPEEWFFVHNIVEDCRIEANEYGRYDGRDVIKRAAFVKNVTKYLDLLGKVEATKPRDSRMEALFVLLFSACDLIYTGGDHDVLVVQTEETLRLYEDKLHKFVVRIVSGINWEECHAITDEIYNSLWDTEKTEEQDEPYEKGGEDVGGKDEQIDTSNGTEPVSKGREESEEVDSGKDGVDIKAFLEHVHVLTSEPPKEEKIERRSPAATGDYPGIPFEEVLIKTVVTPPHYDEESTDYIKSKRIVSLTQESENLAAQLRRYLLVETRDKETNGHRSGRIDSGSLWKAHAYKNRPMGERVFSKKTERKTIDTAVTLLVDQSGSMRYPIEKIYYAFASALILNEVLSKIGVKCRIVSFTDNSSKTLALVEKDFDEHIDKEELARRCALACNKYGLIGNADSENLLWEYSKIRKRREQKKLIITLSDGVPQDSKDLYDCERHMAEVCKKIQAEKIVTLVGIGILHSAVERYYKKNKVIQSANEIETTLLSVLRSEVLHA